MLGMGVIVSLGLLVIMSRLSWRRRIWMTSNPGVMDIGVFVLLCWLHWGSFMGVMVATTGALFTSLTLSVMGWLYGRIKDGRYYPGVFNVIDKL